MDDSGEPSSLSAGKITRVVTITEGAEGYDFETDWYRDLILLATETWEREHNNGQPFQLRRRARR